MDSESAALELLRYMRDSISDTQLYDADENKIKEQAYRDWATCEAINRILDKPYKDAIDILENFLWELHWFKCTSSLRDDPHNPFEIAYDQIETVLAMLQFPEE